MDENKCMTFHPQLILIYLSPVFLICIAVEWYLIHRRKTYPENAQYSIVDTVSNSVLAGFHEIGDAVSAVVVVSVYDALFDFRLFEINTRRVNPERC